MLRVVNQTPYQENDLNKQDAVIMRTFASTHTICLCKAASFFRCSILRRNTLKLQTV